MEWYIGGAIACFIGYAIYKERQALGCPNIPNGTDCDNANGKAVKGTKPLPGDTLTDIYKKIKEAADFADKWVVWRISFLSSVICTYLSYFFIYHRLPNIYEAVMSMFVITSIIYFVLNFYKFHLINHAKNNITEGVNIIAQKCGH